MAARILLFLPPAIFAAMAGLFVAGMMRDDPDALPSAREGQPAPPIALAQLGESPAFTDADLRSGQVKLVNYWASWCATCRIEHPQLMAIAAEGIPVFGINYKDDPENALAFLEEVGNPFLAMGADLTGRVGIDWGLYGVPETFVIDEDGTIRLRFSGPITPEVFEARIRPVIEAAKAD